MPYRQSAKRPGGTDATGDGLPSIVMDCRIAAPLSRTAVKLSLAIFIAGATPGGGFAASPEPCEPQSREEITVRSVSIHLDIALADGRTVRLRGLQPPRGTKAWPELASMAHAALDGWISGSTVIAEVTPGPADRWGRHPARLWLKPKPQNETTGAGNQGIGEPVGPGLIEAGWAQVDPETAPKSCLKTYFDKEHAARKAGLGLWSDPHYQPVAATDLATLTARAGAQVLMEGTILSVNQWKTLTFLNFSRKYSEGLAVMLNRRARRSFEQAGIVPEGLKNKRVRLRGLLELSNGAKRSPRMRLQSPLAIEILP